MPVDPKDPVGSIMHEYKAGNLHSGSKRGPKVRSRAQAIAIGLSEQRRLGQDAPKRPPKRSSGGKR